MTTFECIFSGAPNKQDRENLIGKTTVYQLCSLKCWFNSIPNDKILDLSKLNVFAGDNLHVNRKLKFALESVENIVGRGENFDYQYFLFFSQYFQNSPSLCVLIDTQDLFDKELKEI